MPGHFVLSGIVRPVVASGGLLECTAQKLGVSQDGIDDIVVLRRSLDARKKGRLFYRYRLAVLLKDKSIPSGCEPCNWPEAGWHQGTRSCRHRPVIVGAGPAGLFAALAFVRKGIRPVVLEQGKTVEERHRDVTILRQQGSVLPYSNVLFGEGGAGTYSDGKLTARSRSPESDFCYQTLVELGADPSINWLARPHLGSDTLRVLLPRLRQRILNGGGDIRFETRVTGIHKRQDGVAVATTRGEWLTDVLVPAVGHGADAFIRMLHSAGAAVESKPFAVGVRIEHPRSFIDAAQYGNADLSRTVGAADYRLTAKGEDGRGVYSFCVCPGGCVIYAGPDASRLSINGMSDSARSGNETNGAMVVSVRPDDFGNGPLAGLAFKADLERRCVRDDRLTAPIQPLAMFMGGKTRGRIRSTYRPAVAPADLRILLPEFVVKNLQAGFRRFNRIIPGFVDRGVLVAPETGTSSPVRILRRPETMESLNFPHLFPIGEGAGYSGGIVSSAVDGVRLALQFASQ